MATYKPLSTDFKDDILASQNSKRKYTQVNNSDGTVSFQDSTAYSQVGSSYGAKEVIEEREAINNIYANKLVSLDEIDLVTEPGFFVDAQVVKELNSKIDSSAGSIIGGHGTEEKIGFYIDGNGMKNTLYSKRIQTLGSPVTLPSGCNIVAVDAWMQHNTSGDKYPFPYIDTVSWRVTQVSNFQGNILNWTQGGVDWSNHTGVFVLYYTK